MLPGRHDSSSRPVMSPENVLGLISGRTGALVIKDKEAAGTMNYRKYRHMYICFVGIQKAVLLVALREQKFFHLNLPSSSEASIAACKLVNQHA